jgi:hypothetical protein
MLRDLCRVVEREQFGLTHALAVQQQLGWLGTPPGSSKFHLLFCFYFLSIYFN